MGHDTVAPAFPDKEIHRPTPIPDRVILTWNGDPTTTQAVTFRTDPSVAKAQGQIAESEDGPRFVGKAKAVDAVTTPIETNLGKAHCHSVVFTGLKPSTKYVYRVGSGVNWSEWFQFETVSDKPEPFSFIYFGDAQNEVKSMWSRVVRQAMIDAPKARFVLHAGDLINRAQHDEEWGEWFQAGGWLNAMIPNIPSPGNHEYYEDPPKSGVRHLSKHWRHQFSLPIHGPAGLEEVTYFHDIQGVRIISLDSNREIAQQAAWLDANLANNPNRWTIVTFHHPVYSSAPLRDNKEVRTLWQPIFDKYRVDLVLQGHDHTYYRTGLVSSATKPAAGVTSQNTSTGARVHDPNAGTVYVVSVSGPKMYLLQSQAFMQRVAEDTQLYQVIHVRKDSLRYEARTARGELYDAFTLERRVGQPNLLVEEAPKTPPRRFLTPPPTAKTKKAG